MEQFSKKEYKMLWEELLQKEIPKIPIFWYRGLEE